MADNRIQLPFRLSADHMKNLDKAAKYCGQTRQAFITAAVLAEVAEVLDRKRMKEQRLSHGGPVLSLERQETDNSTPTQTGSTLADALRQRRAAVEAPPPVTTPQGQVVVNVGGSSSSPSGEIERLASYVVAGRDFERVHRLRTAVSILQETTTNEEERRVLAARLDEAIAVKTKAKDDNGGIIHTARVAFDKIADLLR